LQNEEIYEFPRVELIPEENSPSNMIFDTLDKPGRYDRKNKRLSRLSVKSAISRGSNSHQSPNMPIKYNDVDWTHINEQKTHERIEIKKKEFNLNKNKNIVYFS
jgi:hypothetical protein